MTSAPATLDLLDTPCLVLDETRMLRNIERHDPPASAPPPLTWRYDRMVLVASESTDGGSRYRVVARSRPQPG